MKGFADEITWLLEVASSDPDVSTSSSIRGGESRTLELERGVEFTFEVWRAMITVITIDEPDAIDQRETRIHVKWPVVSLLRRLDFASPRRSPRHLAKSIPMAGTRCRSAG